MTVAVMGASRRIQFRDFDELWLKQRESEMGLKHKTHRKHWEHAIVAQTLLPYVEYGYPRVLGFGIGREPMAAWFANHCCRVLATDLPLEEVTDAWRNDEHMQHAGNIFDIPRKSICSEQTFNSHVQFRPVDMRDIPEDLLRGEFDMTWSCGSLEHIGGINAGLEFFRTQMECLLPRGLAVHTTEFNCISNDETVDEEDLCLFREQDFRLLEEQLKEDGHLLWPLKLKVGSSPEDQMVDKPPYENPVHINCAINNEWVTTSVVLVAQAGGAQ